MYVVATANKRNRMTSECNRMTSERNRSFLDIPEIAMHIFEFLNFQGVRNVRATSKYAQTIIDGCHFAFSISYPLATCICKHPKPSHMRVIAPPPTPSRHVYVSILNPLTCALPPPPNPLGPDYHNSPLEMTGGVPARFLRTAPDSALKWLLPHIPGRYWAFCESPFEHYSYRDWVGATALSDWALEDYMDIADIHFRLSFETMHTIGRRGLVEACEHLLAAAEKLGLASDDVHAAVDVMAIYAARAGQTQLLRYLFYSHCFIPDKTAVYAALEGGHLSTVRALQEVVDGSIMTDCHPPRRTMHRMLGHMNIELVQACVDIMPDFHAKPIDSLALIPYMYLGEDFTDTLAPLQIDSSQPHSLSIRGSKQYVQAHAQLSTVVTGTWTCIVEYIIYFKLSAPAKFMRLLNRLSQHHLVDRLESYQRGKIKSKTDRSLARRRALSVVTERALLDFDERMQVTERDPMIDFSGDLSLTETGDTDEYIENYCTNQLRVVTEQVSRCNSRLPGYASGQAYITPPARIMV